MLMLTDCSSCRTPLQLPSGASSVRCTVCRVVTPVALAPAPSPDNGLLSFGQTPSVSGRKRAVICGVSYKGTKFELNGSINDAKCMKYLLVNTFKFPESSILMLTGKIYANFTLQVKLYISIRISRWKMGRLDVGMSMVPIRNQYRKYRYRKTEKVGIGTE
ncbi:putative transcription factor Znf-LSD family [Helianthus annuus]|nr:putative transcription factor Znf-LSD family [Helianthus annuus]KAJ0542086.1 putative transcription factor Znf-LSD family [Helianthus annuus]KAJ0892777.1 putative transcription factor Znf-LSD family [Helianthus annuus]